MYRLLFTVTEGVYSWLTFHSEEEREAFICSHKNWKLKKFDKRI